MVGENFGKHRNLLGKTVITKKGTILGKVDDVELDDLTWTPIDSTLN